LINCWQDQCQTNDCSCLTRWRNKHKFSFLIFLYSINRDFVCAINSQHWHDSHSKCLTYCGFLSLVRSIFPCFVPAISHTHKFSWKSVCVCTLTCHLSFFRYFSHTNVMCILYFSLFSEKLYTIFYTSL
jgi:hypothetical protein